MTKLENGDASTLSSMHYVASASAADASDVSSPVVAALPEEDEGRSLQADTPLQVNVPFSSSFGFGSGVFFAVSVVAVVWGRLRFCGGRSEIVALSPLACVLPPGGDARPHPLICNA